MAFADLLRRLFPSDTPDAPPAAPEDPPGTYLANLKPGSFNPRGGAVPTPDNSEVTYRSAMLPFGTVKGNDGTLLGKDGQEHFSLMMPNMVTDFVDTARQVLPHVGRTGAFGPSEEDAHNLGKLAEYGVGGNATGGLMRGAMAGAPEAAALESASGLRPGLTVTPKDDMSWMDLEKARVHGTKGTWWDIGMHGDPIGKAYIREHPQTIQNSNFSIDPEWQRQGIGTEVQRHLAEHYGKPTVPDFNLSEAAYQRWLKNDPASVADYRPWGPGAGQYSPSPLSDAYYAAQGGPPVPGTRAAAGELFSDTGKPSIAGAAFAGAEHTIPDPAFPNDFLSRFNHNGNEYYAHGSIDNGTANIGFMGPVGAVGPNELNRAALRQWRDSFLQRFPKVTQFSGERLSGSRLGSDDPVQTIPALFSDTGKPSFGAAFAGAEHQTPGIDVWHGSPHDFDKFDLSKIGTGEGAQAYGHGLYFAESPGVAENYRATGSLDFNSKEEADAYIAAVQEALSQGKPMPTPPGNPGYLYQARINANPEHFLDWDKPLWQATDQENAALDSVLGHWPNWRDNFQPANKFGEALDLGTHPDKASELSSNLAKAGYKGIKYLDQGSRYTPSNLPDNPIANEARSFLEKAGGDSDAAMRAFNGSNPIERWASPERDEVRKVISAAGKKASRNYVVFDPSLIDTVHKWRGDTQLYSDQKANPVGAALVGAEKKEGAFGGGAEPMTRKEFREHLNQKYPYNPDDKGKGDRNQYKARKRAYGDYLWHNDRGMFENDYQEFLKEKGR